MQKQAEFIQYANGISCIETGYIQPGVAACYLLEQDGRAALVDTGTWHTVDRVIAVLESKGIPLENVDYVIPTHVHLDHAGGAGELIRRLPNARLVVHSRGARHMIDPARLQAGVIAVYGEEVFQRDYVELVAIPEERVIEAEDGLELQLGSRVLKCLDTPGHAGHHICVWDAASQGFFTGDTFGISYRELDVDGQPMIFATTTPVQFDPEAWHRSLDRMLAHQPQRMFLTHYGMVEDVDRLSTDLRAMLDRFATFTRAEIDTDEPFDAIYAGVRNDIREQANRHGVTLESDQLDRLLSNDYQLNAQGLVVWLERQKKSV